jgi:hypothetical protein
MNISMFRPVVQALAGALLICGSAYAADLRDFTSDGCSLFPDGSLKDRDLWCGCCFNHDIAYWQGGTKEERKSADEALRACVLERTNSQLLAKVMYDGVRAGGHPAFPAGYRWGYGWSYGRGYAPLTGREKQLVREKLDTYRAEHPAGYCSARHAGPK